MPRPDAASTATQTVVPAHDFALSKAFYLAAGFSIVFSSAEVACLQQGDFSFLLHHTPDREAAETVVVHLLVDNVDQWRERFATQDLLERFGTRIGEPVDRPWGVRDFTLEDPSGVLWRISQKNPETGQPASAA